MSLTASQYKRDTPAIIFQVLFATPHGERNDHYLNNPEERGAVLSVGWEQGIGMLEDKE